MAQTEQDAAKVLRREDAIRQCEKLLLGGTQKKKQTLNRLLTVLDVHQPEHAGFGPYSDCQKELFDSFPQKNWSEDILKPRKSSEYCRKWQSILDSRFDPPGFAVTQLFAGRGNAIKGMTTFCDPLLALFKEKSVIPRICVDCYKIQILPANLLTMVNVFFVLRTLTFPRDNSRKCMVELREAVVYPYKGYIFCESEKEAEQCRDILLEAFRIYGVAGVRLGISHGCSEYGLEYPDFKYSSDGRHRAFKRPADWDREEAEYWRALGKFPKTKQHHNKDGITIRDIVGIQTWIDYAEIIGDETSRAFRDMPNANKPQPFADRVREQAKQRNAEMKELQERIAASS